MRSILPALLLVSVGAIAFAAPPKVLFSTIGTSSTSDAPGLPGVKYSTTLGRIYASPNGQYFAMVGVPPSSGRVLTTGVYGTPSSYASPIYKTGPWPITPPDTIADLRSIVGTNDSGDLGFTINSSTNVPHMFKRVGGTYTIVAREGDASALLGATYQAGMTSAQILADGRMAWGSGIQSAAADAGLFIEGQLLAKRGVTIPSGQLSGTPVPVLRFDTDKFRVGQVDNSFIYQGLVGTGTTTANGVAVVVVDNQVVAQAGFALPGSINVTPVATSSAFTAGVATGGSCISSRNRYYAFSGALSGGTDFAAFGQVGGAKRFIFEGEPVATGSSEIWSATTNVFSGTAINSYGEYVVCGLTNNPDSTLNYVVVLNNGYCSKVVYRRSDAIDLDGNGLADDNLAFQAIASDNLMFCDNNRLFLGCTLRTNTATTTGLSQIVIDLPITGDVDGSGEVDAVDIDVVIAAFGSTTSGIAEDIDCSGEVDAVDIDITIANFGRTR